MATAFPLPRPSQALNDIGRPDLDAVWNSINQWYSVATKSHSSQDPGLEHYGGAILLGLKHLIIEISAERESQDEEKKAQVARLLKSLLGANKWMQAQAEIEKVVSEFASSLHWTVFCADVQYEWLFPADKQFITGPKLQQVTMPDAAGRLQRCLSMWVLIRAYITKHPDPNLVQGKHIKQRIKNLEAQIGRQLPDAGNSRSRAKRPASADLQPERINPPSRPSPPADDLARSVLANLAISDSDRMKYVDRYDRNVGIAPLNGLTKAPLPISAENMLTLASGRWVDDAKIEGYLSLVCHEANGHFDSIERPQSPRWHAWLSGWLGENDHSTSWPPSEYPGARIEDVQHHLFPRHANDHWVLFHLWRDSVEGQWQAEFLSSLPGYEDSIVQNWPLIKQGLFSLSRKTDLANVEPKIPAGQPVQRNTYDCGVLLLCAARWRFEGWPLSSLQGGKERGCHDLRERMMVELEKWRLSFLSNSSLEKMGRLCMKQT